uniref:Uncharacterized protein n=1 Tax=Tetranychus urticae TaxID=32264 RepID=T1KUB8_TETUR
MTLDEQDSWETQILLGMPNHDEEMVELIVWLIFGTAHC